MRLRSLVLTLLLGLLSTTAGATEEAARHTVAPGQTLGKIAKRYHVSVDALCAANGVGRGSALQPGQELVIPAAGSEARSHVVSSGETLGKLADRYDISLEELLRLNHLRRTSTLKEGQKILLPSATGQPNATESRREEPPAAEPRTHSRDDREPPAGAGPEMLTVASGTAYFYRPAGHGRLGQRPVIVYLHGRGGQPDSDCRRWAPVARKWGWLVCPSGPEDRGSGRGWANNWAAGHQSVMASLGALREKFGRRVQLYGNTIIGFSEGAYVAMNVGVREPRVFNRWLILAAKSTYWGGPGLEALDGARHQLKRVYLITGVEDEVMPGTEDALRRLREARIPTRIATPEDMGHEVPLERKAGLYQSALLWLEEGKGAAPERGAERRPRTALR
jgi:LysM repeat protein/predicted esterase